MALRVRSLIALFLAIVCILVISGSFIPRATTDSVVAKGIQSGRHYFTSDKLPPAAKEELLRHKPNDADASTALPPFSPVISATPNDPLPHHQDAPTHTSEELSNPLLPLIDSTAHSLPQPPETPVATDDIRLLIGVMSPFISSNRRHIIRNAYRRFPKELPVDVIFVAGDMRWDNENNREKVLEMQMNATRWENDTFHDIMHLDCIENLEDGKTYEYLKKVGLDFSDRYTHVMKTDDDSFVNIPGTLYPN
jgi:hypothetical protein